MVGFSGKYKRTLTGKHQHWLFWEVPLWEYQSDWLYPLTYTCTNGDKLTPDRHLLLSDCMSSPPFLWSIKGLAQTDFPMSVYFHDTANRYGGLYVNGTFKLLTIQQVNSLLYSMVLAEGGTKFQAARIYAGVTLGMSFVWDPGQQQQNRLLDEVGHA